MGSWSRGVRISSERKYWCLIRKEEVEQNIKASMQPYLIGQR